jgi:uncharacterized membrane protein YkvA (DUF1232 family)
MDCKKKWSERMLNDVTTLYYAVKDPRTPLVARLLCAFIVIITLSPIDLIPDFLPVIGYLDDVIILPIGILLVTKMIPKNVMADSRTKAAEIPINIPIDRKKSIITIVIIWLVIISFTVWIIYISYWNKHPFIKHLPDKL